MTTSSLYKVKIVKELSLHILDIIQNSISAEASFIQLMIDEKIEQDQLIIEIKDDGKGMNKEFLSKVTDPFVTSRTTRKVGLGISLLKANAEQCDGSFFIDSKENEGTVIRAAFKHSHIDRPPIGNIVDTVITLLVSNEEIDYRYAHRIDNNEFVMDTREIREILEGAPIADLEVLEWLKNYLKENLESLV